MKAIQSSNLSYLFDEVVNGVVITVIAGF